MGERDDSEADRSMPLAHLHRQALVNQGVILGQLGRFEEALALYKQVIERFGHRS